MLAVLTEQDEENVLAAAELQQQTHGWKNIVRYRELRFEKRSPI